MVTECTGNADGLDLLALELDQDHSKDRLASHQPDATADHGSFGTLTTLERAANQRALIPRNYNNHAWQNSPSTLGFLSNSSPPSSFDTSSTSVFSSDQDQNMDFDRTTDIQYQFNWDYFSCVDNFPASEPYPGPEIFSSLDQSNDLAFNENNNFLRDHDNISRPNDLTLSQPPSSRHSIINPQVFPDTTHPHYLAIFLTAQHLLPQTFPTSDVAASLDSLHAETHVPTDEFSPRNCLQGRLLLPRPQLIKCAHCTRQFTSEDLMQHHAKTHNQFVCQKGCGKKFTSSKDCRRHEEGLHEGLRQKCEVCEYRGRRDNVRRHMLNRHGRRTPRKKDTD